MNQSALFILMTAGIHAFTIGASGAEPAEPETRVLHVYSAPRAISKGAVYDQNLFAVTLQGLVNRNRPRLYVDWFSPDPASQGCDEEWLGVMTGPGRWLHGAKLAEITSFEGLARAAREQWDVSRCVVWDPAVTATVNVATTMAGVLNAPAASPELAASLGLEAVLDLRQAIDYAVYAERDPEKFAPDYYGRNRAAYQWVLDHHLEELSKDVAGYLLDGYGRSFGGWTVELGQRDYLVAERAFVFDLSPWQRTDPDDVAMLERILESLGGRVDIVGFVPWPAKYSGASGWWRKWEKYGRWREWNPPNMEAPEPYEHHLDYYQMAPWSEWEFVSVISRRSSYMAPAHWGAYAGNVTVHAHGPQPPQLAQPAPPRRESLRAKGYLHAADEVAPKHYVMFIVGDMDNHAWTRHYLRPSRFWDPAFRHTPFNWDLNPSDLARIPDVMGYLYETRAPTDHFISAQSGMGYVFPGSLPNSGELRWYRRTNKRLFQRLDIKSMFVFDRHEPAEAVYKVLADIAPDGAHYVIDNSPFGTTYIEDRLQADSTGRRIAPIMSVARPTQVLDFDDPGASATAVLSRGNTQCKGGPSFVSYWAQTTSIKDKDYFIRLETELDAAGDVAIVDSRTFAYLYRAAHGAGNENRATVFAPPTLRGRPGEAFSVEVEVRNDGWNAWTPSYELAVEPLPADGHEATPIAVSRLGQTVEPGASLSVNLAGRVPEGKKGSRLLRYRLRPDEPPHFPAGDAFLQKLLIEP